MNEVLTVEVEKPKRGRPRGRGRPLGSVTKLPLDIRMEARKYVQLALETMKKILLYGKSESAKVAAATLIIERAYGKAPQYTAVDVNMIGDAEALLRGRERIQQMRDGIQPTYERMSMTLNSEAVHGTQPTYPAQVITPAELGNVIDVIAEQVAEPDSDTHSV